MKNIGNHKVRIYEYMNINEKLLCHICLDLGLQLINQQLLDTFVVFQGNS